MRGGGQTYGDSDDGSATIELPRMEAIHRACSPLVGKMIRYSETVQIWSNNTGTGDDDNNDNDNGEWVNDSNMPIRLYCTSTCTDEETTLQLWSKDGDLWLTTVLDGPLWNGLDTFDHLRWKRNQIYSINACVGRKIRGVYLGRTQKQRPDNHNDTTITTKESSSDEDWTEVFLDLGDRWLTLCTACEDHTYQLLFEKPDCELLELLGLQQQKQQQQ